jgi:excisionase family DNA binding protein
MVDGGTSYETRWTEPGSLLTISEAATLLRVSRATVYRLLTERELPRIRVRGHSRIARADVAALIERRRAESVARLRGAV